MNYEEFKKRVVDEILNYLPDNYQDYQVELNEVKKTNRTLDGMQIFPPGGVAGKGLSPCYYIQDMYDRYKENGDFYKTVREVADHYRNTDQQVETMSVDLSSETVKENVIFCLINAEQNKEMLSAMPHRMLEDLAIVYRYVVSHEPDSIASTFIKNELMKHCGLTEPELYKLAYENTKRLFPVKVVSIQDELKQMLAGTPEQELLDCAFGEEMEGPQQYIISNEAKINGAAAVLYIDEMKKLADKLRDDLYIMPSSIHEMIAVSATEMNPDELSKMVTEINQSSVPLEDRLSNQVYHFDRTALTFTKASHAIETKLGAPSEFTYNEIRR